MEYEIIYSKRKTLSVSVRNGKVVVRAPIGLPKGIIAEFLGKHREWIEKQLEKSLLRTDPIAQMSKKEIEALRSQARIILTDKTQKFSKIMDLKYGRITITGAKTRYGSCSSKGNISYSYRLMLCPEQAIDYVVVHELAHLKEMNHSKRFYALVEKILPDYKERIKLLKSLNKS